MSLSIRPTAAPRLHVAKAPVAAKPAPKPVRPVQEAKAEGPVAKGGAIVGAIGGAAAGGVGGAVLGFGLMMAGMASSLILPVAAGAVLGAGVGALALGGAGKLVEWVAGLFKK